VRVIISDFKDFLAKGWFFVIGDLDCISQFAAVFYPDGFEKGDFKIINVIIKCGDEKGQYKSVVPVFIAKRKEELREVIGKDLDRLMAITFEKDEKGECMPRITAPGWFTRKLALYVITERLRKQCKQQPGIPSVDLIEAR
jgi:hypothetical protein